MGDFFASRLIMSSKGSFEPYFERLRRVGISSFKWATRVEPNPSIISVRCVPEKLAVFAPQKSR